MSKATLNQKNLKIEESDPENTFVIPVIFNYDGVARCIETIYKYNERFRIILIDQTKDGKCSYLKDKVHIYMWVYRNLGFAKAMNAGAKLADTPYITLCNDDVEFISSRWLPAIIEMFKHKNLLAINPASVKEIGPDRTKDWMPYKEIYTDKDYDYLLTEKKGFHPTWIFEGSMMFCTVFRKEAFDIVGWLDEGFYPGCFVPKSKVLMKDLTYKNIEYISDKDKIISRDGKANKIKAISKRYYKGDILEIQLVGTNEKIHLTPDHKLFIVDRTGPKGKRSVCWSRKEKIIIEKEAKDVQERDLLYFPKLHLQDKKFDLINYESFLRKLKTYNIENDKELFKIFGYFLAEGNYIKTKYKKEKYYGGLTFSFHIKETKYINEIKSFCDRYEIPYTIYLRPKKTITTIEIYSSYLARIFLKLFGEYSYGKFIHSDILQCSNELLKELFLAYSRGDGCISKNFKKGRSKDIYRQLEIKTVSRKLAESVHILLLKLFIPHLIYFNQKKKQNKHRPTHDIYISQTYFAELFNTKGSIKRKRNEVFKEDNKIFYPIRKIRKIKYKGFVYDLKIENNHSYIVNQIAVHNSGEDYDWCRRCYEKGYKLVHYNGSFIYHHWLVSKNRYNWESPDLKKYRRWPGFREKWMTDKEQDPDIYGKKAKGVIRPTLTIQL